MISRERPLSDVPRAAWLTGLAALALYAAVQAVQPAPAARAQNLRNPLPAPLLRIAAGGEPNVLGPLLTLYLQAFDNQPGVSVPFRELDYPRVVSWLAGIRDLDAGGQYPLLLAAQVYSQVPDPARIRLMLDFIHGQFLRDPNRYWRWLAHAAIVAKHRLHDDALALSYAREITRLAPAAPDWAKQMQIFILEDMGEVESAKILLGGLLVGGQITDSHEIHFLTERLKAMDNVENSSAPPKR